MNIDILIQLFAEAKFESTTYPGDLSGKTYWEGAQSAYLKILNAEHPGWSSTPRGKEVWMCGASDYAVLIDGNVSTLQNNLMH